MSIYVKAATTNRPNENTREKSTTLTAAHTHTHTDTDTFWPRNTCVHQYQRSATTISVSHALGHPRAIARNCLCSALASPRSNWIFWLCYDCASGVAKCWALSLTHPETKHAQRSEQRGLSTQSRHIGAMHELRTSRHVSLISVSCISRRSFGCRCPSFRPFPHDQQHFGQKQCLSSQPKLENIGRLEAKSEWTSVQTSGAICCRSRVMGDASNSCGHAYRA